MEYTKIGAPRFDGQNYAFWNKRMQTFLQAHGFDVWKSVVDGYAVPTLPQLTNMEINSTKTTQRLKEPF
jgi:hypothetical protein